MKAVRRLRTCLLVVPLIFFDQLTKVLAVRVLGGGRRIVLVPGVLELTYVQNRGAAFGILQNARLFFLLITAAALVLIGYVLLRIPEKKKYVPMQSCLYLIAAGAVGNLIDRVALSYVRDFIYFSLIDFPVFNVADIFITCATLVLLALSLFYYREEEDFAFLGGQGVPAGKETGTRETVEKETGAKGTGEIETGAKGTGEKRTGGKRSGLKETGEKRRGDGHG